MPKIIRSSNLKYFIKKMRIPKFISILQMIQIMMIWIMRIWRIWNRRMKSRKIGTKNPMKNVLMETNLARRLRSS